MEWLDKSNLLFKFIVCTFHMLLQCTPFIHWYLSCLFHNTINRYFFLNVCPFIFILVIRCIFDQIYNFILTIFSGFLIRSSPWTFCSPFNFSTSKFISSTFLSVTIVSTFSSCSIATALTYVSPESPFVLMDIFLLDGLYIVDSTILAFSRYKLCSISEKE